MREALTATPPAKALAALQPTFAAVLADPTWLPERWRSTPPAVLTVAQLQCEPGKPNP